MLDTCTCSLCIHDFVPFWRGERCDKVTVASVVLLPRDSVLLLTHKRTLVQTLRSVSFSWMLSRCRYSFGENARCWSVFAENMGMDLLETSNVFRLCLLTIYNNLFNMQSDTNCYFCTDFVLTWLYTKCVYTESRYMIPRDRTLSLIVVIMIIMIIYTCIQCLYLFPVTTPREMSNIQPFCRSTFFPLGPWEPFR